MSLDEERAASPSGPEVEGGQPEARQRLTGQSLSYAGLLECLYDATLITDRSGRILDSNRQAQKMTQYSRAELENMVLGDVMADADAGLMTAIETHWETGWFTVLECQCRRRDGTEFPAEIAAGCLRWEDGYGWCFTLRNITRRKQAEEAIRKEVELQLQRARAQSEFAGQLHIVSVADLVQMIDSSGKSGCLEITRSGDGASATLSFDAGRIVQAVCGACRGAEAFYAALALGGDAFRFQPAAAPTPADPDLPPSTMNLLLEGMRRLPRGGGLLCRLGPGWRRVPVSAGRGAVAR